MLTNHDIHDIYQYMQKFNGINISTGDHPEYIIGIEHKRAMVLYGTMGRIASIPTTQLSDIHAILQLCHPDKPYYIRQNLHLSDNCPRLPLYIYKDQPDIITTQDPRTRYTLDKNEGDYIINTAFIPDMVINQDEDYIHASKRMADHLRSLLPFIKQYPNIEYKYHQLHIKQPNISYPQISLIGIIARDYPSNMRIHLGICYNLHCINLPCFTISIDDIPKLPTIYHAHIAHAIPDIIHQIHEEFSHSQHEKIRIIHAITQQLTSPNDNVIQQIYHAATIMRDHFVYIGTLPHPDP